MKGTIARSIGAITIGSLLALSTSGMAAASSQPAQAAGQRVLELRDQLTKVAYAGDVQATRAAVDGLQPLLNELAHSKRYALSSQAQQTSVDAAQQASRLSDALAHPQSVTRQLPPPPAPGLPPLPSPLTLLSTLVQSLLLKLTTLVGGLLGSAPPLPVPPASELPPAPVG